MQKLLNSLAIGMLVCTCYFITGCKKNISESSASKVTEVKNTEESDNQIEILGNGFGNEPDALNLQINGEAVKIEKLSDNRLVATIPDEGIHEPVQLSVNGNAVTMPAFSIWKTTVSTYAGTGVAGYADGSLATAQFNSVDGIAIDTAGNLYIADATNNRIRKITKAGVVSTLAGTGVAGFADGNASAAMFSRPTGIAVDANQNIVVGDRDNNRIRKITPLGIVTTIAGTGVAGLTNGSGSIAKFSAPSGITTDAANNIYVSDMQNNCIRRINTAGVVSMYAGTGFLGFGDGSVGSARFTYPTNTAFNASGHLFVADRLNNSIRKIAGGWVSTVAGNGWEGATDGTGANVTFLFPFGITVNSAGSLFISDQGNHRIRKISTAGVTSTYAGSVQGYQDGNASVALFEYPRALTIDSQGSLYVGEKSRIRKVRRTQLYVLSSGGR